VDATYANKVCFYIFEVLPMFVVKN